MATEPLEIVAAPFELYLAPVGEAFPVIGAEPPGGNWVLVGTSGEDSTTDEGVTATFTETLEGFRSAASTGQRKVFRTEEDLAIALVLADTTLAAWAHALNFNTVGTSEYFTEIFTRSISSSISSTDLKALKLRMCPPLGLIGKMGPLKPYSARLRITM